MASGVELATAWVKLVPSADGIQGELTKTLEPEAAKAGETAGKTAGTKFSTGMRVAVSAASALVVKQVVDIFQTGMEELKFGEQISAQTDQLIKNTGFTMMTEQIEDFTLALSRVSGISEEDLQSAGNNIIKFGNVSEENYRRAVESINDLGASGKDVAGVSEALGKALADPAKAAGLLKRQGVLLNEEQQTMIDKFIAAGDMASAQGVILDGLEGTYGGMAETVGNTMTGQLNKLENAWQNVAGVMVETVLPAISAFLDVISGFVGWLEQTPGAAQALAIALGILVIAIIAVNVAMWAMAANPVVLAIAAIVIMIGLVIAALVLLAYNWDAVVQWVGQVWMGFVNWLQAITAGFVAWWNGIWAAVGAWFQSIWNGFVNWVKAVWSGFVGWLTGIVNGFVAWWNGIWTTFGNVVNMAWNMLVNFIRTAWSNVSSWLMGAINGFFGWWNGIWNTVGDVIRNVFGGIAGFLQGVWNGIVSTIRGAINSIIGAINGAIGAINGIIGAVGGLVGLNVKIPNIPKLATGGTITRSGSVIVGERGPELLNLPRGASVDPDIPQAGGPRKTVVFNNYAPLGQSPAQALTQFANRAEVVL